MQHLADFAPHIGYGLYVYLIILSIFTLSNYFNGDKFIASTLTELTISVTANCKSNCMKSKLNSVQIILH